MSPTCSNSSSLRISSFLLNLFFVIAACLMSFAQDSFMINFQPTSNAGNVINRGDFNNDGIPDIVVGNNGGSGGSALTVYLSNGDGTFKPPLDSAPALSAFDIAVGDFNGDGKLDVAVAGYVNGETGILQIMLGNGDGTFTTGQVIDLPNIPRSITAGDFNGDGKLDLAVSIDKVYFYQNSGTGTFTNAGSLSVGPSYGLTEIRVGDFNGDGKPDIAATGYSSVYVLYGTGSFTFNTTTVATYKYASNATPVDVNQDGLTDLVISYYTCDEFGSPNCPGWQVLLGVSGKQSLAKGFTLPPSTTYSSFGSPTAADINGDGFNDIVALGSTAYHYLLVWLGNPDGTFQSTPLAFNLGSDSGSIGLVASDFNRDGKIDFATAEPGDATTAVLLGATPPAACKAGTVSPSITECQPVNHAYYNSPLKIVADATDTAHRVTSMQVYINNSLKYTVASNSLNYSATLSDGAYSLVTKAWDSAGKNFQTDRSVNIYTGTPGSTCATVPGAMTVCSPTQNETTSTTVHVLANSNSTSAPITAVQVYIDNALTYDNTSQTTYVNQNFSVAKGSHTIVVKAFDANGKIYSQSIMINAQ